MSTRLIQTINYFCIKLFVEMFKLTKQHCTAYRVKSFLYITITSRAELRGARGTPPEKSHGYYSIYVPVLNALPDIGKKKKKSSLYNYRKTALTPKNKREKKLIHPLNFEVVAKLTENISKTH